MPDDNNNNHECWRTDGNNVDANEWLGTRNNQPLRIRTNDAPRMIITEQGTLDVLGDIRAGNSAIYFTNPDHNHNPIGNTAGFAAIENAQNWGGLMILGRTTSTSPLRRTVKLWDFLQINGDLDVTGVARKPGGGAWSVPSDVRLKKSVKPLKSALDKLLRLRGVTFEWKEPEKQGNLVGQQMGLVAQEVEEVFPQWVDADAEGYKNLTVKGFEALTIEAFKELKADYEALRFRIEALERA